MYICIYKWYINILLCPIFMKTYNKMLPAHTSRHTVYFINTILFKISAMRNILCTIFFTLVYIIKKLFLKVIAFLYL